MSSVAEYLDRLGAALEPVIRRGGRRFLRAFGEAGEDLLEFALECGRAARLETCHSSLLDAHARNSGLPRVRGESDESFRKLLLNPWETFRLMGTSRGLLRAVERLGYRAALLSETDYNLLDRSFAFGESKWFFHLDIFAPSGFEPPEEWEGGWVWEQEGALWDIREPYPGALGELVDTVRRWKPAGSSCRFLRFELPDRSWVTVPCAEDWEYSAQGTLDLSRSPYLFGVV